MKTKRKVWKETWAPRRRVFTMPLERYLAEVIGQEVLRYQTTVVNGRCVSEVIGPVDSRYYGYRSEGSSEKIATDNLTRLLDKDGFIGQLKK